MKIIFLEFVLFIYRIFIFFWQLPQNIIGIILFIILYLNSETIKYKDCILIITRKLKGGMCLGNFIFVDYRYGQFDIDHEYGHHKQSKILGLFYLIIIGMPSFMFAILRYFGLFKKLNYYNFYTEKWANKLGGIS